MPDQFNAPEWVKDAIFYQIFPERFANGDPANDPAWVLPWGTRPTPETFMGGDLQGILDRLPYLQNLGINAVYLTPIFSARSTHKYDTADYMEVDPIFGSKSLLKTVVNAAHAKGIRVIFDAVFNHCGDGFWAFLDVQEKGRQSAYWDWFIVSDAPIEQNPPNYQTCGGVGFLPKLNLANPQLRKHLLDVAAYWLKETGMDGWRLDVPWKAPLEFWREFRRVVKEANPQAYIVAEAWRDSAYWLEGDTCDAVMNYPLREYILDYCARDAMDAEDYDFFVRRLLRNYAETAPFQLNLLGSHDTPRLLTLCGGNVGRAVLAMICLFTTVGTPMLYYGDENGMAGENDPDCRRCMVWEPEAWNPEIRNTVKKLITLRKQNPVLSRGSYETLLTFNGVYVYRRCLNDEQAIVVTNPRQARSDLLIPLKGEIARREWVDVLSGLHFTSIGEELRLETLGAQAGLVLVPYLTNQV